MAVNQVDYKDYVFQFYESNDETLIPTFKLDTFLTSSSCIEFIVYDPNQIPLYTTYNFTNYTLNSTSQSPTDTSLITQFSIDPKTDAENAGFDVGEYVAYYNFLTKRIGDNFTNLFIKEISSDRTEILLDSTSLSNQDIIEQTSKFIEFRENSTYFVDFYLNFGDNQLVIANNIKLQDENTDNPKILVKLYEPLPSQFELKSLIWIVTQLAEPEAFSISFPPEPIFVIDSTPLQGPNFNIPIKGQVNNSSQNLSEKDILSGAPTSSLDHIESLLNEKSINISVDYTDFSDFIHFSSGKTRLENFYYKASLIEGYSASISDLSTTTSSATSTLILQSKISEIIKNFDGYDRFLYYTSGSEQTWPKTTTEPPYLLAKTGSAAVVNWLGSDNEVSAYYGGMILSASNFDNENNDQLLKSIPEYLREDAANQQYDLFVDMVAQYYDNVWLYTKDVTQKYNADNRLDSGVSKDLVADAIKDFGLKLYQNNFSNSELYTAFLGLTPNGSLFPFPNITGSTPVPSGYELVDTMISASNDVISMDDTNKSLYKRIYHNIPYLLNSKGTIPGLRALITSYGIPDTILKISEFGGKDKVNENDWDFYFNKFNYAWDTQGTNNMSTPWEVNSNFRSHPYDAPGTVEFRFQTTGLPDSRVSQSLWFTTSSAGIDKAIVLEYTGSYLESGPYSGSIPDPYNEYGTLKYISNPGTINEVSCSVYLPFFNGDWWSVMVRNNGFDAFDPEYIITEPVDYDFILSEDGSTYIVRESSTTESLSRLGNIGLFAANKIYNGNDGTQIGFTASSSIDNSNASGSWITGSTSYFAKDFTAGSTYQNFSGSMQEVRYYNVALGTTRFYDYTMNPLSIEGNGVNYSPNELTFRAALGSELDTNTTSSIHPKVTGSWTPIASFSGSDSLFNFNTTPLYDENTEYYFLDQFPAGIKNRITDKIRYEDSTLPSGSVLSPIRSLSQMVEASASYTDSINYLEVAFSPQNQINDDIISQIGYFNVGDYIGDPRQRSSSAQIYPELNALSEDYFKKYIKQYDLTDFVRLIKFFDNSLFKMIKDFIPTRTSLASGLVIKQHLLERNKYPQPQVSYENKIYTGSIDMVDISGGPGGVFNDLNAPAPEIIFSFSSTYSVPFSGTIPQSFFQNFSASVNSTIRGKINEYNILSGSITTTEPIKMYDGENFYIETKTSASADAYATQSIFEWKISPSSGATSEDYGFWAVGTIPPLSSTSSFSKPTISRVTGSTADPYQEYQGKITVWDEDNDYLNMNYLPKDTLYKQDVNFQRWDESFPSLIGDIPKLHDNQDEFYDGEFSGSVILVTNGELNEGCEAKEIQVRPNINYQVRVYGCDAGGEGVEFFYDSNTWKQNSNHPLPGYISLPIAVTQIYYPFIIGGIVHYPGTLGPNGFGTEEIKISRFDSSGFNMSPTLSQLSSIKIKFDDIGWITYDVGTITQYPEYFYYKLKTPQKYGVTTIPIGPSGSYPNGYTGSLAKPEYDLTGSLNGTKLISSAPSPKGAVFIPCTSTEGFSNEFFNSSAQRIEFNTYAQKEVNIKAVFTASEWTSRPFNPSNGGIIELFRQRGNNPPEQLTNTGAYNVGFNPQGVREHTFTQNFNQGDLLPGDIIGLGFAFSSSGLPTSADNIIASFDGNDTKFYISSSESTVSINQVITDPFLTSKFQNTDCDVLLGEVEGERPNPFLQDLDYQTSQTVPVNYGVVVSQSATRATIPESYYTAPSQINNRYVGSKNQSSDFNVFNPFAYTSSFGTPINIGTFGQTPSVESLDTTIYEFNWGGGTTPEILGWGAVKMGKLLQVNSTSSVRTINPSEGLKEILIPNSIQSSLYSLSSEWGRSASLSQSVSDYYYKLNSNNPLNHEISMNLYGSSTPGSDPTLPSTTRILTTEYGVPTKSTFVVTSSAHGSSTYGSGYLSTIEYNGVSPYPFLNSGVPTTASYIRFFDNKSINLINKDYEVGMAFPPQSLLITGSYPVSAYVTASFTPLAEQLNNGERYFATFYLDLEEGFDSSNLVPLHYNTSPLGQKGVVEIVGIAQSSGTSGTPFDTYLLLKDNMDMNAVISQGAFYTGSWDTGVTKSLSCRIGAGDLGCFIWKARAAGDNEFVMVQDSITGGVSAGAFTSKYATQEITDNFEDITKTYGSNKQ